MNHEEWLQISPHHETLGLFAGSIMRDYDEDKGDMYQECCCPVHVDTFIGTLEEVITWARVKAVFPAATEVAEDLVAHHEYDTDVTGLDS